MSLNIEYENEKINHLPLSTILDYIKNSIDVIVQIKLNQEIMNSKYNNSDNEETSLEKYEALLRKEEREIRNYISIEHQLRLHCEQLNEKIEELKKENKKLKKQLKKMKNIETIENELENLKTLLHSYEETNLNLSQNEKRLKTQLMLKDKQIYELEQKLLLFQSIHINNSNRANNSFEMNQHLRHCKSYMERDLSNLYQSNKKHKHVHSGHNISFLCSHSRSKSNICGEDEMNSNNYIKSNNAHKFSIQTVDNKKKSKQKIHEYRAFSSRKKKEGTRNKKLNNTQRDQKPSNKEPFILSLSYFPKEFKSKDYSNKSPVQMDISVISKKHEQLTQRINNYNNDKTTTFQGDGKTPTKRMTISHSKSKQQLKIKQKGSKLSTLGQNQKQYIYPINKKTPSFTTIGNKSPFLKGTQAETQNNNNTNYKNYNQTQITNTIHQFNIDQYILAKCGVTKPTKKTLSKNTSLIQ